MIRRLKFKLEKIDKQVVVSLFKMQKESYNHIDIKGVYLSSEFLAFCIAAQWISSHPMSITSCATSNYRITIYDALGIRQFLHSCPIEVSDPAHAIRNELIQQIQSQL